MGLSVESPITTPEQDILARKDFAKNLAKQIAGYNEKECLTIGLLGGWGTGKSSVLNMVKSYGKDENFEIIEFTPWYFSGREQLISDFFQVLSKAVGGDSDIKGLGKDLLKYSSILKPLSLIPSLSIPVEIISKGTQYLSDILGQFDSNICLDKLKQDISNKLEEYPSRIVVFIDEIDRLNKTEIVEIFQLVRALGDFKNVIYLLAFDDNQVCNITNLEKTYIEKIINIPIYIPELSEKMTNQILLDELGGICEVCEEEEKYWRTLNEKLFQNYFLNLREIYRFINILKFNKDFIMKEVNHLDFLVISFFQIFELEVYNYIKENGLNLCWCFEFGRIRKPTKFDEIVQGSSEIKLNRKFNVHEILLILFSDQRIHSKQINNLIYFPSYFIYSLDERVYSYEKKNKILSAKTDEQISNYIDKSGANDFLMNINDITDKFDKNQLLVIIKCVLQRIPTIEKKNMSTRVSNQKRALENLYSLIIEFDKNDDHYVNEIMESIVIADEVPFNPFVKFISKTLNHFEEANKQIITEKLQNYIYEHYSTDVYRSFDHLEKIGIDIREYVKKIIADERTLFKYLKDISMITNYGQVPDYDHNGQIIDVEEYTQTELSIEDLNEYSRQEEILNSISKMPEEIQERHSDIIRQVKNPRKCEEIIEEMERKFGDNYELILES